MGIPDKDPAQCKHGHFDTSPDECAKCLAEESADPKELEDHELRDKKIGEILDDAADKRKA